MKIGFFWFFPSIYDMIITSSRKKAFYGKSKGKF